MLLLGKAHIGEVQVSTWDDETIDTCRDAGDHPALSPPSPVSEPDDKTASLWKGSRFCVFQFSWAAIFSARSVR